MDSETIQQFDTLYNLFNPIGLIDSDSDNNSDNGSIEPITITKERFLELVPAYLNKPNTVKRTYINGLSAVTEDNLIYLLMKQDAIDNPSFYYLSKKFNFHDLNETDIFSNQFRYRMIRQEPYYVWVLLKHLKKNSFINKHFNDEHMMYILQDKIEMGIVDNRYNFKFDLCFPKLHLIIEINEYHHEESDEVRDNDEVKSTASILTGHSLISLRIAEVFGLAKRSEFNRLSDREIHDTLRESQYLKDFLKQFEFRVLSALLTVDYIKSDYAVAEFKRIITEELVNLYKKRMSCDTEFGKEIVEEITFIKDILDTITTSSDFKDIFNLKDRCFRSESGFAITFEEILTLLNILNDVDEIIKFKKTLYIKNIVENIICDDVLFSWEQLSKILNFSDILTNLKNTLLEYYRKVETIYQNIDKMTNIHYKNLISSKEILEKYMIHANTKYQKAIHEYDSLVLKYKMLQHEYKRLKPEETRIRAPSNFGMTSEIERNFEKIAELEILYKAKLAEEAAQNNEENITEDKKIQNIVENTKNININSSDSSDIDNLDGSDSD